MLQNLLKVFNGYWRMDFPDWVGDTCWGLIIKTWNSAIHFLPSFSYLLLSNFDFSDKIHFPTWWWWHFTGILKKETFFVIQGKLAFLLQQSQLICFNFKATVLTIFLRVVKRNILFFPLDSKNRRFTRLQRVLFFGGDFLECRDSSFFEKISKV